MAFNKFMQSAIYEAQKAFEIGEVPVGAVITLNNEIIATGYNMRESTNIATAHAEIIAINNACKFLKKWQLTECDLYVTLKPCPMCTGAIIESRIKSLYFGAYDDNPDLEFCGKINTTVYGGIMEKECSRLLQDFFRKVR